MKSANCSDAISNEVMITVVPLPDVTVTQSGNQLTATNAGAGVTYQWVDCDNSNAPVAGATSQVFDPTSNGNYAVEVTENGCSDISACFAISSIGIVENEFGSDLKVYPNPTNGAITIDVGEHAKDLKLSLIHI